MFLQQYVLPFYRLATLQLYSRAAAADHSQAQSLCRRTHALDMETIARTGAPISLSLSFSQVVLQRVR